MKSSDKNEKMSYVRKALTELIDKRELRSWCMERNLPHSTVYSVAVGSEIPPFALICKMLPYFSPAEWVYFTDEEIPYKHKTLPVFNPKDFSVFIKKHKLDYMDVAEKLGISEVNAKNIFLHRRANLSLLQIRKLVSKVNPEEFFTVADDSVDGLFYPERGDIVSLSGKNILVLSKNEDNVQNGCFVGVIITDNSADSISIKGEKIDGFVAIRDMSSFTYARRNPVLVDKVDLDMVSGVLKTIKRLFS